MEKLIKCDNLRNFAYVNENICKKPIKGIVVSFFGLGGQDMYAEDTETGKFWAEKGVLFVVPYGNPWAWMNAQQVSFTDEIIDVLIKKHGLADDAPIVSTGGSMGGQSALVYTVYAKRTPVACVANCPVCDMPYHFTERPDLPRTMYSAFYHESGTMDDALKSASPLHLVKKMPRVEYHVFHCNQDKAVNISAHSEKLIAAMKAENLSVTFDVVDGRGHCNLTDEMRAKYCQYALDAIENHQ